MDKALYFLLFFLLSGWAFALCANSVRRSRTSRSIFIFIMASALTMLSVYTPELLPLRFGEELAALDWAASLKEQLRGTRTKAERFLEQNCTLIDVSHDLVLLSAPDQPDSTSVLAITDRARLATLFQWLARDTGLFDVVVVDVLFDLPTAQDSALARSLELLAEQGRLALAAPPKGIDLPSAFREVTLTASLGRIDEEEHDGIYFEHVLVKEREGSSADLIPSLPYRAYALASGIEHMNGYSGFLGVAREHGRSGSKTIRTWFHPQLLAGVEEDAGWWKGLGAHVGFSKDHFDLSGKRRLEALRSLNSALPLGMCTSDIGSGETLFLHALFKKRHEAEGPHFVVVGNFLDPERDVHQTIHGPMHGTAIIIGILHELFEGGHHASWSFTLFMLLAFAVVVWLLVLRSLGRVKRNKGAKAPSADLAQKRPPKFSILRRIVHALFLDELHYWMLFVMLLVAMICFDRVINIMSIALFLISMELVFRSMAVDTDASK